MAGAQTTSLHCQRCQQIHSNGTELVWTQSMKSAWKQANTACSLMMSKRPIKDVARQPFRVSVEGNIGSGKSTLIKHFANFPEVDAHMEPVEIWQNVRGVNLLELLYTDLNRWNFAFQSYVQLSRLKIQTLTTSKDVQIFERSLQNNRFLFVEVAHDRGFLSDPEYVVLCEWYNWISSHVNINLDLIVYLRCDPQVAFSRIQARGRPEERSISLKYVEDLHAAYEKWLLGPHAPAPVLQLDVNQGLDAVRQQYNDNRHHILGAAVL